jgi:hypothetical protein
MGLTHCMPAVSLSQVMDNEYCIREQASEQQYSTFYILYTEENPEVYLSFLPAREIDKRILSLTHRAKFSNVHLYIWKIV